MIEFDRGCILITLLGYERFAGKGGCYDKIQKAVCAVYFNPVLRPTNQIVAMMTVDMIAVAALCSQIQLQMMGLYFFSTYLLVLREYKCLSVSILC